MINHSKTHITAKSKKAVLKTIESGLLIKGEKHNLFKSKISNLIDKEYVDLTSSGTFAFFKILTAIGISEGDEVLIPNYICSSLLGPIRFLKATPVVYDNRKNSWLSDIEMIKEKTTFNTKIILLNHTYGFLFKGIEELRNLIPSNIVLVEDCCHALSPNSQIGKTKISQFSLCSFYSFNATKMIASGEGGAIATDDRLFYEKICKIKLGDNLSDLSCSLGLQQIDSFQEMLDKRSEIANQYKQSFGFHGLSHESLFYRYPILVSNNQVFLKSTEISYRLGVDELISDYINTQGVQNSKDLLLKIVSVPIYPALKGSEIKYIIQSTKKLIDAQSS